MKTGLIIVFSILLILGICVGILYCALPQIVFRFIFYRPKRSTKVPKYYIGTPHYQVSRAGLQVMKNMKSEDVYMESRDHLKLHAYLFPIEGERKKFVIGIHGYKSYSRPEYAPYFEFYHSHGFNMLLPDDRAHAPSEGTYIGFGVLDRLDCVDYAKYLVKTYGEDITILLHGVSMGGATVVSASGEEDLPHQVVGIVSDCAFSDGYKALEFQLEEMAHLPSKKLLPKVEKILERKAHYNLHDYTAVKQVQKAKVPMLFVQGMKDQMVPPYMVDELYRACPSEKRLLKVEEAAHGESIAFAKEEYHRAIIELFHLESEKHD